MADYAIICTPTYNQSAHPCKCPQDIAWCSARLPGSSTDAFIVGKIRKKKKKRSKKEKKESDKITKKKN